MKKIVTGIITGLALITLAGCGSSNGSSSNSSNATSSSEKKATVKASNAVLDLFKSSTNKNIDKGVTQAKVDKVKKEVEALKPSKEKTRMLKDVKNADSQVKTLAEFSQDNAKNKDSSSSESKKSQTENSGTKDTTDDYSFELSDGTEVQSTNAITYKPKFTDTSWRGGTLKVKAVTVRKTEGFDYYDGNTTTTMHGVVVIRFTYQAQQDVRLFDDQAKLTADNQQVDVDSDDSDTISDINSTVNKTGHNVFLFPTLKSVNDIKSIRWQFDSEPQDEDSDDFHSFDFTINLNN